MGKQENNIINQQLVRSYFSSVVSIALVLFLMGLTALVVFNARSVSRYFKERLAVQVVLSDHVKDADSTYLKRQLLQSVYLNEAVREAVYISAAQGAREMEDVLGGQFMEVFAYNPLPSSVELRLYAAYVQRDSLDKLRSLLLPLDIVKEVNYEEPLIEQVNQNVHRLSLWMGGAILLLLIISIGLIFNTIKLSVFSKRFTIYAMSLVGATQRFIRRPFMGRALLQGLLGALVALLLLLGLLFLLRREAPALLTLLPPNVFLMVSGGMIASGVLLCQISTFFVVNKVVRLDKNNLYY